MTIHYSLFTIRLPLMIQLLLNRNSVSCMAGVTMILQFFIVKSLISFHLKQLNQECLKKKWLLLLVLTLVGIHTNDRLNVPTPCPGSPMLVYLFIVLIILLFLSSLHLHFFLFCCVSFFLSFISLSSIRRNDHFDGSQS